MVIYLYIYIINDSRSTRESEASCWLKYYEYSVCPYCTQCVLFFVFLFSFYYYYHSTETVFRERESEWERRLSVGKVCRGGVESQKSIGDGRYTTVPRARLLRRRRLVHIVRPILYGPHAPPTATISFFSVTYLFDGFNSASRTRPERNSVVLKAACTLATIA